MQSPPAMKRTRTSKPTTHNPINKAKVLDELAAARVTGGVAPVPIAAQVAAPIVVGAVAGAIGWASIELSGGDDYIEPDYDLLGIPRP